MKLTHADARGKARMVDVGSKAATRRRAVAESVLHAPSKVVNAIRKNVLQKGDALAAARLAGIMAAKRTPLLIPLCHPVAFSFADVSFRFTKTEIRAEAVIEGEANTGFEMEALVAAAAAALTLYDMAKGLDKGMTIGPVRLMEKSGGKSGAWRRKR
jgi:cyclic pyranopterin monophosphate synthase